VLYKSYYASRSRLESHTYKRNNNSTHSFWIKDILARLAIVFFLFHVSKDCLPLQVSDCFPAPVCLLLQRNLFDSMLLSYILVERLG
jgi:hypothetical protein